MTYGKPLPEADHDSAPYWQGCRDHVLRLQYCTACVRHQFPPGPMCQNCRKKSLTWRDASGRGTVYSWIVVTHPVPRDIYGDDVPYVVALVELAEGVRLASNIVDCPPDAVYADMPVEVIFDDVTDEITLPKFKALQS